MGIFKKLGGVVSQGLGVFTGGVLGNTGYDTGSALISGIPLIGEGFAAQQAQNFEAQQAQQANLFNAQQAQINRDFQERMSNSAYQRQMADMEKAGLNPMLVMGGSGASTPSGASASAQMATGKQASGAKEFAHLYQLKGLKSQIAQQDASKQALLSSAKKTEAEEKAVEKNLELMQEQIKNQQIQNRLDQDYGDAKNIISMLSNLVQAGIGSAFGLKTLDGVINKAPKKIGGAIPKQVQRPESHYRKNLTPIGKPTWNILD